MRRDVVPRVFSIRVHWRRLAVPIASVPYSGPICKRTRRAAASTEEHGKTPGKSKPCRSCGVYCLLRDYAIRRLIAYPTARRDFLQLVDRGYLTLEHRGKRFVFMASRRLRDMFTDTPSLARLRGSTEDMSAPA